ncbi:MAG: Na(+)/H(+) antiporter subunit B [Acidobacteriota bacterium]
MIVFRYLILLLVGITALGVVRTRDTTCQVLALSFYGLLLAVMFFVFQAPDVALSQIAVGAVALPLMVMLALARMKHSSEQQKKKQEAK